MSASAAISSPAIDAQDVLDYVHGIPFFTGNRTFNSTDALSWMRKEKANIVVVSGAADSPSTDPVVLGVLGLITHEDFWADATGGYRGPTRFTGALTNVKASLKLAAPTIPAFQPLWKTSVDAIHKLTSAIAVPAQPKNGFSANGSYKFSHLLFEVCPFYIR